MMRTFLAFGVLLTAALTCFAETRTPPLPPQPAAGNRGTYFVLPIRGVIGSDFTAARMEVLLQQANKLSPSVVVLEIDTGGGSVHDAEQIIDLIIANKNLRFVALVHRALSAGAAIALACKEIYITDTGTVGGGTYYRLGDDGNPVQLPAHAAGKFQPIWLAVFRKAAEHGGHPSLLAEAMADPNFPVTIYKVGDKAVFRRDVREQTLKADNCTLTLTAMAAVSCGLAKGIVADIEALGSQLSMSEWQALGKRSISDVESGNMTKAESGPSNLYTLLFSKAVSLRLTQDLTTIQRQNANAEWNAWLKKQSFQQTSVRWTLCLVEARDRRAKTYARGYDDNGKLLDHFRTSGKLTDFLRDRLRSAEEKLDDCRKKLPQYRSGRTLRSSDPTLAELEVQMWQPVVSGLSRLLEEAEAYPIEVFATCPEEPSSLVVAFISKAARESLTRVSPGNEITLSGCIDTLAYRILEDRAFLVIVQLDHCMLVPDQSIPAEVKAVPADSNSNRKAAGQLNLARAFLRNGLTEKATAILRSILSDYPGTTEAQQAQGQLDNIEQASRGGAQPPALPKSQ